MCRIAANLALRKPCGYVHRELPNGIPDLSQLWARHGEVASGLLGYVVETQRRLLIATIYAMTHTQDRSGDIAVRSATLPIIEEEPDVTYIRTGTTKKGRLASRPKIRFAKFRDYLSSFWSLRFSSIRADLPAR